MSAQPARRRPGSVPERGAGSVPGGSVPERSAGRRKPAEPADFVDEVEDRLTEIERRLERIDENVQAFCYTLGAQIDMQVETAELLGRLLGRLAGRIEELEALLGSPGAQPDS